MVQVSTNINNKALPHCLKNTLMAAVVTMLLTPTTGNTDTITLVADEWCPFNCAPNSEMPGYAIEIATVIMKTHGHTIKYELSPWDAAISQAREGKYNAIIGAFHGDAPDFVFPKEPIGYISGSGLFTLKSNEWEYQNIDSLKSQRLGAILAYDYGEQINQFIKKHRLAGNVELISGHQPLRRNIQKMMIGRLTVVIDASPVFWYTAKSLGVTDKVKFVGEIEPPEEAFIAFSPNIKESPTYAATLSAGIEQLRKSGELNIILHKYGLQDWK